METDPAKATFTGERFIPELFSPGNEIYDAHTSRYAFATDFVQGKIVLDISSGDGYGSDMMAQKASHVYGVDKDADAVAIAKLKYKDDSITFSVGVAEALDFPDAFFDAVVSFETIEHLDSKEQRAFIDGVRRVLKPGGTFIISTPDKDIYGFDHNEFHVDELNKKEFVNLLASAFAIEKLYGQGIQKKRNGLISFVRSCIDLLKQSPLRRVISRIVPWSLRARIDSATNKYSSADVSAQTHVPDENMYALHPLGAGVSARYIVAVCTKR